MHMVYFKPSQTPPNVAKKVNKDDTNAKKKHLENSSSEPVPPLVTQAREKKKNGNIEHCESSLTSHISLQIWGELTVPDFIGRRSSSVPPLSCARQRVPFRPCGPVPSPSLGRPRVRR